jgi:hypothetical protein
MENFHLYTTETQMQQLHSHTDFLAMLAWRGTWRDPESVLHARTLSLSFYKTPFYSFIRPPFYW